MLAICKKCQGDIVVEKTPESSSGQCPYCKQEYFITLDEQGEACRIVFDDDVISAQKKVCMKCGREFTDVDDDTLGVCGFCRSVNLEIDTGGDNWLLRKADGTTVGPTFLEELKDLAMRGFIASNDQVSGPGQSWTPAGNLAVFKDCWPKMRSEQIRRTGKQPKRSNKRVPRAKKGRFKKFIVLTIILGLGYVAYDKRYDLIDLSKKYIGEGQKNTKIDEMALLVDEIKSNQFIPVASVNSDEPSFALAEKLMNADAYESYVQAYHLTRKSAIDLGNDQALGLYAEALAYLASFKRNVLMQQFALKIATTILRNVPGSVYGFAQICLC